MRLNRVFGAAFAAVLSLAVAFTTPAAAADLSVTAANVVGSSNAIIEQGVAGETVTAGQAVYRQASTGKWFKADADSATAEVRAAKAIAVNGAAANQPVTVQKGGSITIGATLTAGAPYYLSNTAGGIMPTADLSTGEYVDLVGLATSTSVLMLQFAYTGVATP